MHILVGCNVRNGTIFAFLHRISCITISKSIGLEAYLQLNCQEFPGKDARNKLLRTALHHAVGRHLS